MSMIKDLKIVEVRRDGGTQPRLSINPDIAREYAEEMTNGAEFPPVTAFFDGKQYWLADGFYRVEAAILAGRRQISAEIRNGSARDAILFAVGANTAHGIRRSNDDKRKAVTTLLTDEEWQKWSDSKIARQCAVSGHFVGVVRKELSSIGSKIERMVERKGSVYAMNTAHIGQGNPSVESDRDKPPDEDLAVLNPPTLPAKSCLETANNPSPMDMPNIALLDTDHLQDKVIALTPLNLPQEGIKITLSASTKFADLANWSWIPVSKGPTPGACSNAILIMVAESTPVDKRLKAFVNHAAKLKCAVFLTQNLDGLVDTNSMSQK